MNCFCENDDNFTTIDLFTDNTDIEPSQMLLGRLKIVREINRLAAASRSSGPDGAKVFWPHRMRTRHFCIRVGRLGAAPSSEHGIEGVWGQLEGRT
jgi:hypothetical protein